MLSSDHFAVEICVHKRLVQTVLTPSTPAMHVRDCAKLIHAQMQDVQRWSSHVQACMSDLARQTPADKRLVLDDLYDEFLEILWNADPKLYRCSRAGTRKQPTWWNDACFDAMLARNAAWRVATVALSHFMHFVLRATVSTALFMPLKASIGHLGSIALSIHNRLVLVRVPAWSGVVSAATLAALHLCCDLTK